MNSSIFSFIFQRYYVRPVVITCPPFGSPSEMEFTTLNTDEIQLTNPQCIAEAIQVNRPVGYLMPFPCAHVYCHVDCAAGLAAIDRFQREPHIKSYQFGWRWGFSEEIFTEPRKFPSLSSQTVIQNVALTRFQWISCCLSCSVLRMIRVGSLYRSWFTIMIWMILVNWAQVALCTGCYRTFCVRSSRSTF